MSDDPEARTPPSDASAPGKPAAPPIRVAEIHVDERRTTVHVGWLAAVILVAAAAAWGARTFYEKSRESMKVPEGARLSNDFSEMVRTLPRPPGPPPER